MVEARTAALADAQAALKLANELQGDKTHLQRLFEQAPGFICVLRGPEHVFELANAAYRSLTGGRDLIGKPVRAALARSGRPGLRRPARPGVPHAASPSSAAPSPVDLHSGPDGGRWQRATWTSSTSRCSMPTGAVIGIFVQGSDVTEQKLAQDALARHQIELETPGRARARAELTRGPAGAAALAEAGSDRQADRRRGARLQQRPAGHRRQPALLQRRLAGNRTRQQLLEIALHRGRARRQAVVAAAGLRAPPAAAAGGDQPRPRRRAAWTTCCAARWARRSRSRPCVAGGLWNTLVDPNQLENVILNLAINARDAMPGGGKLTIELGNAHAGRQLRRRRAGRHARPVRDAGRLRHRLRHDAARCWSAPSSPSSPPSREGEGTGLGLSMAYGFVKQTGGHFRSTARSGSGTTIKMYLPRALRGREPRCRDLPTAPVRGGSETILVVEDDPAVQATVVEMLGSLGYRVLKADDADERAGDPRERHADRPAVHRRRHARPAAQPRAGAPGQGAAARTSRCCSPRATRRTRSCTAAGSTRASSCCPSPTAASSWRARSATCWPTAACRPPAPAGTRAGAAPGAHPGGRRQPRPAGDGLPACSRRSARRRAAPPRSTMPLACCRRRSVDVLFTDIDLAGQSGRRPGAPRASRCSPRVRVVFASGYGAPDRGCARLPVRGGGQALPAGRPARPAGGA